MEIITTKSALQQAVASLKAEKKTIGLVPTMGALHEGHATLIRQAVREKSFIHCRRCYQRLCQVV